MKRLLLVATLLMPACAETLTVDLSETTVELDAFSGLPNPKWQLTDVEEVELEKRLQDLPVTEPGAIPENLGYRGFVIVDENGTTQRITVTRNGFVVKHDANGGRWYEDKHGAEQYLVRLAQARGYGSVLAR